MLRNIESFEQFQASSSVKGQESLRTSNRPHLLPVSCYVERVGRFEILVGQHLANDICLAAASRTKGGNRIWAERDIVRDRGGETTDLDNEGAVVWSACVQSCSSKQDEEEGRRAAYGQSEMTRRRCTCRDGAGCIAGCRGLEG